VLTREGVALASLTVYNAGTARARAIDMATALSNLREEPVVLRGRSTGVELLVEGDSITLLTRKTTHE